MTRLESDYYAFMGFDSAHTRAGQSHYVQFFPTGPVLELGSGRGEFLDLLREAGVPARGVDSDDGMVAAATAAGHDVTLGDAIDHLAAEPPGALGGVFCAHFLEHLTPDEVTRVYAGVARALRPGGTFVAAVPHAGSLAVLGHDFWLDPTHVRFYHPTLLAFFAAQAGLEVVATGGNPRNSPGPPTAAIAAEWTPQPGVSGSVPALVQQARGVYRTAAPEVRRHLDGDAVGTVADPRAELWSGIGHLIAQLDERLQAVQHQYTALRTAYQNLLAQLYPASEVYVVAKRPTKEDPA
jgi:hypothetical protein